MYSRSSAVSLAERECRGVTLPNQKPLDELIVLGGAVLGLEQPKEKVDEDGQDDREDK
jgi:hypothetical protein